MVKGKKTSNDVKLPSVRVCHYCRENIYRLSDLREKPVALHAKKGKELIRRQFHKECIDKFEDRAFDIEFQQAETSDWDKVYKYFQKEYLGLTTPDLMQGHVVNRLRGMRVGKYYEKANNVTVVEGGYSYDIIHKAMIIAKVKALGLASSVEFSNFKHKVDFLLKFVTAELETVKMRMKKLEESNKATEKAHEKNKNVQLSDDMREYEEMLTRKREKEESNKVVLDEKKQKAIDSIFEEEVINFDDYE